MPEPISIRLDNLQEFERLIENFQAKLEVVVERKPVKIAIGELLIARARQTIKNGGTGSSPAWAPLKKATIDRRWELEQKKKKNQRVNKQGIVSNAPLQRTGIGMQSLNYRVTSDGLVLSAVRYMGYQQTGTKPYVIRPKNKKALNIPGVGPRKKANHPGLPKRPFFIVLPEDIDAARDIVIDAIRRI